MLFARPFWSRQGCFIRADRTAHWPRAAASTTVPFVIVWLLAPIAASAQACPIIASTPTPITGNVTTPCSITATASEITFSAANLLTPPSWTSPALTVSGSENDVTLLDSTINVGNLARSFSVTGSNNTLVFDGITTMAGTSGAAALTSGALVSGGGNVLIFTDATIARPSFGSALTVSGTGNQISFGSGAVFTPTGTGAALLLSGSGNTIDVGSGASLSPSGSGISVTGTNNTLAIDAGASIAANGSQGLNLSGQGNAVTVDAGAVLAPSAGTALVVSAPTDNAVSTQNLVTNNGTIGSAGRELTVDITLGSPTQKSFTLINHGTIINQIRQGNTGTGGAGGLVTIDNRAGAVIAYMFPGASTTPFNTGLIYNDQTQNNSVFNTIIRNAGTITGTLSLGQGRDLVINSGTINGYIDLGPVDSGRQGTLVLRPGWVLTGAARSRTSPSNAVNRGLADLSLSGEGTSSFDMSEVGAYSGSDTDTLAFQGFGGFIKEGPSTWTLTGIADANYTAAGQAAPPVWWVSGGKLIVDTQSLPWNVTFGARNCLAASECFGNSPGLPVGYFRGDPDFQPATGASAVLEFNQDDDATYDGIIAECTAVGQSTPAGETCLVLVTGALVKSGTGELILTGANSYTGGTTLSGGTLAVSSDAVLGAAGGALTFDGGTLKTLADLTSARPVFLESAGGAIDTNGYALVLSGAVQGSGGFIKQGLGTVTLSGTNTFSGSVAVQQGTLELENGSAIGDSAAVNIGDGATLDLGGFDETIGALSGGSGGLVQLGSGTLTVGSANTDMMFGGTIGGSGGLVKTGSGRLTLTGFSSFTGTTDVLSPLKFRTAPPGLSAR
jgi:fibronectin-binding autotransporter adhesin